ncbi:MAG: DUF2723 domain-containing protein [Candidatus Goldbacteria bacterium]|nr:DUF2723 domain-containing protein [Candidatus Goldiibacteriota bacterium]
MKVKNKFIFSLIVFLFSFYVFIITLNPVFHANDSPETVACAFTLGIQHPPGYPLVAMLGKIFTFLPVGNVGFRVNISSAFFASLSVVFVFLTIVLMFKKNKTGVFYHYLIAIICSFCIVFSYTIWSEALSAKGGIYTLNLFFVTFLTWIIFKWSGNTNVKWLYLFSFIYGLSYANHWESIIVITPAFLIFVFLILKKYNLFKSFKPRNFFIFFILFLSGISAYLFLLIRARYGAILNWGNPDNLYNLIQVVLREQYAEFEKAKHFKTIKAQALRVFNLILNEINVIGLILTLLGIIGLYIIREREKLIFFITVILTLAIAFAVYFNLQPDMLWVMDVFMIPIYTSMAFLIAGALLLIVEFSERFKMNENAKKIIFAVLFSLLPLYYCTGNFKKADQSRYFYAYDFGMNVIKSADEPDAVVLLEGDFNVMPQMYFKYVTKKTNFCPVTTIFLYKDWGVKNFRRECPEIPFTATTKDTFSYKVANLIALNYNTRPVYTSIFKKTLDEFYPEASRLFVSNGFLMKLRNRDYPFQRVSEQLFRTLSFRGLLDGKSFMNSTTKLCVSNYSSAYMELGNSFKNTGDFRNAYKYLNKALIISNEKTRGLCLTHLGILYSALAIEAGKKSNKPTEMTFYEKAIDYYTKAIEVDKTLPEPYSNLSGIYNNLKQYDLAIDAAIHAIKLKPNFPEAYNNLAIAYYNKGDKNSALNAMQMAVNLSPDNEMLKMNLEQIKAEIK